mgnify:CR=1 FL=1
MFGTPCHRQSGDVQNRTTKHGYDTQAATEHMTHHSSRTAPSLVVSLAL